MNLSRTIRLCGLRLAFSLLIASGIFTSCFAGNVQLASVRVATGLNKPLLALSPNGDFDRLFIVQQDGQIMILELPTNVVNPTAFLDICSIVNSGGERGLLGLAFHPNYLSNGLFYVVYSNLAADNVLSEFQVSADPNLADATSERILLTIAQPFSNHNGGMIAFSPLDSLLYYGLGDGGAANDPGARAQDLTSHLGKMLRLDVSGQGALPYLIPASNPFSSGGGLPEIWAYGLRNPWRFSFDRENGDLYIGDVGQGAQEEIDYQAAVSSGGENYGWRCMEGDSCTGLSGCACLSPSLVDPIVSYPRTVGSCVTGGYVYRGCAIPELQGEYFFADFATANIWSFNTEEVFTGQLSNRTVELDPGAGLSIGSIASFGEDSFGEIYICDLFGGEIFKIVEAGAIADCNSNLIADSCEISLGLELDINANQIPDSCEPQFIRGDLNQDGVLDISDASLLLAKLFLQSPINCQMAMDVNDDGLLDISDPVSTLAILFAQQVGPPPPFPSCGVGLTSTGLSCDSYNLCP